MQTYDPSTIQPEGREIKISREEISVPSQPCKGKGIAAPTERTLKIPPLSEKDKLRFYQKISTSPTESGCFEWTACKDDKGYGRIGMGVKIFFATRIAYFIATGTDPCGFLVCHHCDNPSCVTPEHLFLGSSADNMRDKERKGRGNQAKGDRSGARTRPERMARGETNGKSKLANTDIPVIRADSRPRKVIAEVYGVSYTTISSIKNGKSWLHVA